jgi:hypothetical protein
MKWAQESLYSYVKGFTCFVYMDHRNNLFTDSFNPSNFKWPKKLLRWAVELSDFDIIRVWVKGSDHILGDAPSRNPINRDQVRDQSVEDEDSHPLLMQTLARLMMPPDQHHDTEPAFNHSSDKTQGH